MTTFYILQKTIESNKGGVNAASFAHANELQQLHLGMVHLVHTQPTEMSQQTLVTYLHEQKGLREEVDVVQPSRDLSDGEQINWLREILANSLLQDDVVLINEDKSLFAAVARYKHAMPMLSVIQVLHNSHVDCSGNVKNSYKEMFVRQDDIDRFIVLTKQQQLDLASEGWLRPEKLVYLPNVACALPVKSQKSDPQPVVNVFTRYNDRQKGLSDFLDKIMPAVVRRVPNVQVNFYGAMYKEEESSVAAPFQQLVRENNLENNVSINDYVDGVTKAKLADESLFTVLPSNYEGMPLAVLEMAKHSVPTIAYDVKYGPAELIQDGVNGYLVDHGDTDTFVNRMVELLQQPKLARYFGDQVRKLVLADYQEKSVLSLWQELLGDLTMEMVTTKFDENKAEYVEVTNAMTNTVVRKFSDFETAYVKNSHGTRVLVVEYTTQDEGQRYMHVLNEHESVDMMIAFDQFEKQRFLQAN